MSKINFVISIFMLLIPAVGNCEENRVSSNAVENSEKIYQACFSTSDKDMIQSLEFMVYPMLVTANPGRTHESRDYVINSFAPKLSATPSPIQGAFKQAAGTAAKQFSHDDIDKIVSACAANLKTLPGLPQDVKGRLMKIVTDFQLAQAKQILKGDHAELEKRGLLFPPQLQ
ncbi:MAG: hypothetical protein JWM91_2770 [Rhodospirillales bacterium]|nr:hypothetical protein [Rhodospirillales bacterium]